MGAPSPHASVCLNLADDHLQWHGSARAYRDAKAVVNLVGILSESALPHDRWAIAQRSFTRPRSAQRLCRMARSPASWSTDLRHSPLTL